MLHAKLMFEGSLASARQAAQLHVQKHKTRLRSRAPLNLIDVDFSPFIGTENIDIYFGRAALGDISGYPLGSGEASLGLKQLFYSCLFIVVQLWPPAHTMSKSALQWYKSERSTSSDAEEALYCYALTCRFNMASVEDYRDGLNVLDEAVERLNRRRDTDSRARTARARSERAALRLFALYRTYLSEQAAAAPYSLQPIVVDHEISSTFDSIIQDIESVQQHWLESDAFYENTKFRVFSHRLKLQLYSNIGGAWMLRELASGKISLKEVGKSRSADLNELGEIIKEDAKTYNLRSGMANLNYKVLSFIEASGKHREDAREAAIEELESRLKLSEVLLPLDRVECEVLIDRLRQGSLGG